MSNIKWLYNLIAGDLNIKVENVKARSKYQAQIERYVKGEIWDYSKLLEILKEMMKKDEEKAKV